MQNNRQLQHTNEDTSVYNRISKVDVIIERAVCILRHLRSGEDGYQIARTQIVKTYKQTTCNSIIPHEDRCSDNTSNSERHIDNLINNQGY